MIVTNSAPGCAVVEGPGCCVPPQRSWSLREIVKQFASTPGTQLNFYVSDVIHPAQQNELLSYKASRRVGGAGVTRTTMSHLNGKASDFVPLAQLYDTIARDLSLPIMKRSFFTYISSPGPYGIYAESDTRDFQLGYQQLMPISTSFLVA